MGAEKVIKVSSLSRSILICDPSEVNAQTYSVEKGSSPRDFRYQSRYMIEMGFRSVMKISKSSEKIGKKVMGGRVAVEADALLESYWKIILCSLLLTAT